MRRVCPACSRRTAELVAPDCSICEGHGVIILHPAALSVYDPAVVSEAVALSLEAVARGIDSSFSLSDDRRGKLRDCVGELLAAQIIARHSDEAVPGQVATYQSPAPAIAVRPRTSRRAAVCGQIMFGETPQMVAEIVIKEPVKQYDTTVLNALPHVYSTGERPLMRGLPVLSAAGHPSHLARIEDPQDAYTATSKELQQRKTRTRQARALAAAAAIVAQEKVSR